MIKIKICGITNKKEIEYVNILKPDYIGFVFTKSKRKVNGEMAVELLNELDKEIRTVGVFRDNSIKEILNVISKVKLDVIQLHGQENMDFVKELRENLNENIKIWRALSITDNDKIQEYFNSDKLNQNNYETYIDNFLIDGANPGSGESFSLDNLKLNFNNHQKIKNASLNINENEEHKDVNDSNLKRNNFFLAGGINEENVLERIQKINPIGVDVSSGVEIIDEYGQRIKSFEKMKTLIDKVRNIEE